MMVMLIALWSVRHTGTSSSFATDAWECMALRRDAWCC